MQGSKKISLLINSLMFFIVLYPIFSVLVPPLVDYPSHLARFHIENSWYDTLELQKNYVLNFSPKPNMAADLLMLPLTRLFPIYDAGRIAIATTQLTIVGGIFCLRKVLHGSVGLWPLLAYLMLYNHAFYWGFLEYLISAGLAFCAFSLWIALRNRAEVLSVFVFTIFCLVLYIGHIFGLFIYGLLVTGYEAWIVQSFHITGRALAKRLTIYAIQFILPSLMFFQWITGSESTHDTLNLYGSFFEKIIVLFSPVHFGNFLIDLVTAIFLWFVFVVLRRSDRISFAPEIKYSLILLVTATILMPNYIAGVWGTDFRLSPIIAFLIIAGIRQKGALERRVRLLFAVAISVLILRSAAITSHWNELDKDFREFRQATKVLDKGSSLLVMMDENDFPTNRALWDQTLYAHIDALAIIEQSTFNPLLVTGVYTVDASAYRQKISSPVGEFLTRKMLTESADLKTSTFRRGHETTRYKKKYWIGWPKTFDYVLAIRFKNLTNPYPDRLEKIKTGSFFDIYSVIPDTID